MYARCKVTVIAGLLLVVAGCVSAPADEPASAPTSAEPGHRLVAVDTATATADWPRAVVLIPELPAAPVIDGVAEAIWGKAAAGELKYVLGANEPVERGYTFRIGHRTGVLYVLMRWEFAKGQAPVSRATKHDGRVWADDGAELFFVRLDNFANPVQLMFNLSGVQGDTRIDYDAANEKVRVYDAKWNPAWQVKCKSADRVIVAEVAVPMASIIGIEGKAGEVFRLNVVWKLQSGRHGRLEWSPVAGPITCRPTFFGIGVIAGPGGTLGWADLPGKTGDVVFCQAAPAKTLLTGSPYSVTLLNPLAGVLEGKGPGGLKVTLTDAAGKQLAFGPFEAPTWPQRITLRPGRLPAGTYRLSLALADGEVVFASPINWRPWVVLDAQALLSCRTQGRVRFRSFPKSSGRSCLAMYKGSRIVVEGAGRAVYLRLSPVYILPGPRQSYSGAAGVLRCKIDDRPGQEISIATAPEDVPLAEDLPDSEHKVVIEAAGDANYCQLEGVRFAKAPLGGIGGIIVTDDYGELLADVRAEVMSDGKVIRTRCVRSPHNSRFAMLGLEPGRYTLRLEAAGWEPMEIEDVVIDAPGRKVDLGVIVLKRDQRVQGEFWDDVSPKFGRSVNISPGGSFTTKISWYHDGPTKAQLVSRFKTIDLKMSDVSKITRFGRWNWIGQATFHLPADVPEDMYDLQIIYERGDRKRVYLSGQAVCVREPLGELFHVAGCGHTNTASQATSEYLTKVGQMAELAGARMLMIANEVNAAYVSGALKDLRIPYLVVRGNHTASRWDDFFAPATRAYDDGSMRVVIFGDRPYLSWHEAGRLIKARPEATNRVLLCFEGFAPIDLIRDGRVDMIFDGHSDDDHPDLDKFPKGTMHLRAPGSDTLRWITMSPDGLAGGAQTPNDVKVLPVNRDGPAPLRAEHTQPNDGTAATQTTRIVNDFDQAFGRARLRFVMAAGAYVVRGAKERQSFKSDDGSVTVIDVEVNVPATSTVDVRVAPR